MFKAKVTNCGNYNCVHCSDTGRCNLFSISINSEGRCNQYSHSYYDKLRKSTADNDPDKEIYPNSNIC